MVIKRILWPTDLSEAASKAEPYVASLSKLYDAEIHLIYVAEDLTDYEHYWGSGPDAKHLREMKEYEMRIAKERLEELCTNYLEGCPSYRIHVLKGDPAKVILGAIEEYGADLVVLATRGMKSVFPFGSVAERVVKSSPVPVITINR